MSETVKPAKPISETLAAKRALKAAGYEVVSCRFGRGTARSWIECRVTGPWTESEFRDTHYSRVYGIVKHAAGRDHLHDDTMTDLFVEQITLDYVPRPPTDEEYAAMSADALDARIDGLRRDLGRMKDYGVTGGVRVEMMKTDLARAEAAQAAAWEPIPYADGARDRDVEDDERAADAWGESHLGGVF